MTEMCDNCYTQMKEEKERWKHELLRALPQRFNEGSNRKQILGAIGANAYRERVIKEIESL